jgi:hypothetical protein
MRIGLWVYGAGLLVPLFTQSTLLLALAIPLVAFGGGVIMTLPYALLMPMMLSGQHGALSGFHSLSRGLGTALGPAARRRGDRAAARAAVRRCSAACVTPRTPATRRRSRPSPERRSALIGRSARTGTV